MNVERSTRDLETPHGRVATLTFLSRDLSGPRFSEPLAQCLGVATGASVALVRFEDVRNATRLTGRPLDHSDFVGSFQLPSQLPHQRVA
jgi:hypothetical protein